MFARPQRGQNLTGMGIVPVSYTHLDVYKRQDQCLGIGEQMVAQQMPFHPPRQPTGLYCQTLMGGLTQGVARQGPFDPVHNSE